MGQFMKIQHAWLRTNEVAMHGEILTVWAILHYCGACDTLPQSP